MPFTQASSHAVVVGGSSGMGFATAQAFLDAGHRVTLVARDADRLARAAERLGDGDRVRSVPAQDGWADAIEGTVDHLVATAGGPAGMGSFAEVGADGLMRFLSGKAVPQLDAVQALLPHLAPDASITLTSGAAGRKAVQGFSAVGAANAAIEATGQVLALELAPIRVNIVSPGFVATEAYDGMPEADRDAMFDQVRASTPLARLGTAEDVAALIIAVATNPNVTSAVFASYGGAGVA